MEPLKLAELSRLTGMSPRTLQNWASRGVFAPVSRGRWDPWTVVPAISKKGR